MDENVPTGKIRLGSPLDIEVLYDELGKEEKPKNLPMNIKICGGILNAADVVKVNDQDIEPIEVELAAVTESVDCDSAQGRVSLKELGKHFQPGINSFDVRVGEVSNEVVLEVEF